MVKTALVPVLTRAFRQENCGRYIMTFSEYKNKFSINLTKQQEEAVLRAHGKTLLLAVPGSGKTTVTVARLGYLVHCEGVSASQLLTLTYSVASCCDMKSRYIKLFGEENVPEFRTINGICSIIIRHFERVTGRRAFSLSESEKDSTRLLSRLYLQCTGENPTPNDIRDIKAKITYARNMLMTSEEIAKANDFPEHFSQIFEGFRAYKRQHRIMDYDDQLEYAYTILRKYPDILDFFCDKFRYISVDEAQDTSKLQHEIIGLLAKKHGNLFMVGDEDQSIYGFRAAYPQALLDFEKTYPDAAVLFIERNFRSTPQIVRGAERLIDNNRSRRKKNMYTEKADGEPIKTVHLSDYEAQSTALLEQCRAAYGSDESTAILFRNNESALPVINLLDENNIPYAIRENDALFFTGRVISDILKLLAFCENPARRDLILDLIPRLGCGLSASSRDTVERALTAGDTDALSLICLEAAKHGRGKQADALREAIGLVRNKSALDAIKVLCDETCFGHFLERRCSEPTKLSVLLALAGQCGSINDFLCRMEHLAYCTKQHENPKNTGCVVLSTVHSSKGLEFDNVIIIDVRNGIFPSQAPTKFSSAEKLALLEEERRLFYVALTRARSSVKIYVCEKEFGVPCEGSQFLDELFRKDAPKAASAKVRSFAHPAWMPVDLSSYRAGTQVCLSDGSEGIIESLNGDIAKINVGGNTRGFNLTLAVKSGYIRKKS